MFGKKLYEEGDMVEFVDDQGKRQLGKVTGERIPHQGRRNVVVEQTTGPAGLRGIKRLVEPAEPEPEG